MTDDLIAFSSWGGGSRDSGSRLVWRLTPGSRPSRAAEFVADVRHVRFDFDVLSDRFPPLIT